MSWDQILGALGANKGTPQPNQPASPSNPNPEVGNALDAPPPSAPTQGAQTPGVGKQIGDTLLGSSPRTDSIPNFTHDVTSGLTSPHGLLGQAVRLVGAIAAFGHSPAMGLQYLNMLDSADAGERKDLAEASARGWTPEEYAARTGQQVPADTRTALQARDAAPGGPSLPDRVNAIQFPNTPEELTAARDAELNLARSMPDFGQGVSRETATQQAQLAQRRKMPLDASEKTVLEQNAMMEMPEGAQYSKTFTASDEGLKGVFRELPPEDRSMDMDTYQQVQMPPGYEKIPIPDQENPGRMYMKIVNTKTGQDFWDIASAAGRGDPNAIAALATAKDFYTSKAGAKPAKVDFSSWIQSINSVANDGSGLTPEQIAEAQGLWKLQGKSELRPGENNKKMQDFLIKVGAAQDPNEVSAENQMGQLQEELRANLQAERTQPNVAQTGATPSPMATPGPQYGAPQMQRPAPQMTAPPAAGPAAIPNAPPIQPKPLPTPGKEAKKHSFNELQPEDLSTASGAVLDALAKSGPDEAVRRLATIVNKFTLSEAEKEMLAFSVIQGLHLPASAKLELHNKAKAEIE